MRWLFRRFLRKRNERPKPMARVQLGSDGFELGSRLVPAFLVRPPDSNGLVQVIGSSGSETANITVNRSSITINGSTFAASAVRRVDVGGKAGADTINTTYNSGAFNPVIRIWGDQGSDKVEVWNGRGKDLFADGGGDSDRIALHGQPFLGQGRQLSFETFWTDAKPHEVAQAFLGRNVSELKFSGDLPMSTWPGNNVCCANFVSSMLEVTGRITASQHQDSVSGLTAQLQRLGWRVVPVSQARAGDVWIDKSGGRSHTEIVLSNNNGAVTLIGANNVNSDGSQRITTDGSSYRNSGSYVLTPP